MLRRSRKRVVETKSDEKAKIHKSSSPTDQSLEHSSGLEDVVFGGLVNPEEQYIDDKPIMKELKPAWSDEDDDNDPIRETMSLPINITSRKSQFEKSLGPAPDWAQISRPSEDENLPSKYLSGGSTALPKDFIDVIQCVNVNIKQPSKCALEASEFHKTAQIAMTASQDCSLNLFQIDGKKNAKIHGMFLENFPIRCAHFLTNDKQILISSNFHWMYSYDMISGKIIKIPYVKGISNSILHRFKVSPDGQHIVFMSKYGKMHLIDSTTKELIATLKMNGTVEDVAFMHGGRHMLSVGDEGIVYIWDMNSRMCIHTFVDEGCCHGTSIAVSPNNNLVACGSSSGIVSVYDDSCMAQANPIALKSFKNLQTPTTSLQFNPTSEILALSSSAMKGAFKLAHMTSMSVFSNFPDVTQGRRIQNARQIDFSPNSGYFQIGTAGGRALLYRLNHYQNY